MWWRVVAMAALGAALAGPVQAQGFALVADADLAESAAEEREERVQELMEEGREALDEKLWERAVEKFTAAAAAEPGKADAALYWKAYAQAKAGQRPEALRTVAELRKAFTQSRWLSDAQALEIELRGASGAPVRPESEQDEELKLVALNSLMNMDPEKAVPMLEKLLRTSTSPKLKDRALFVLSQSGSPRARQLVLEVAKGNANPDLQRRAIRYLGMMGGTESKQVLSQLYASADPQVKREVLQAFMVSGDEARVLEAARAEKDEKLRSKAIHLLGAMGAHDELWDLYKVEAAVPVKRDILQALAVGGAADRLAEVARTEKSADLRRTAVRSLGIIGAERSGALLAQIYASDESPAVKEAALEAMFIQGNAKALIDIARKEKDRDLKKKVVGRLALMNSKEATDFLLEILEK